MGDGWVVLGCAVAGEIFDMRGFADEVGLGITRLIFNAQGADTGWKWQDEQDCTKGVEMGGEKREWVVV